MDTEDKKHTSYEDIIYAFSIFVTAILIGITNAIKMHTPVRMQKGGVLKNYQVQPKFKTTEEGTPNIKTQLLKSQLLKSQLETQFGESKWLNTFFALAGKINDVLHYVVENAANKTLDSVIQYTLGDLGTKPINENILDRLKNITFMVTTMTRDPEVQLVLQNIAQEITVLGLQMMDTVQPQIDEILKKAIDTLNQSSEKAAKGLVDAGLSFVASLIGNIPVYGGIVTMVMVVLRGFNDGALALAPDVEFSVSTFIKAFNTVLKMIQDFNKEAGTLIGNVSKLKGALEKALSLPAISGNGQQIVNPLSLATALPNVAVPKVALPKVTVPKVTVPNVALPKVDLPKVDLPKVALQNTTFEGGANKKMGGAKLRRKINHISRRLQKTINRFMKNKKFTRKA